MDYSFEEFFKKEGKEPIRAKFLSRVFGVFSEELVRIWANDSRAPYANLGRPTLRQSDAGKGFTLDFTFQHRITNKVYVVEMKCEIEYENFRYMVLSETQQLKHHKKEAFTAFLDVAKNHSSWLVFTNKVQTLVNGAILIWGDATSEGRTNVIAETGCFDVITLSDIIRDLKKWNNEEYQIVIQQRERWMSELFSFLL